MAESPFEEVTPGYRPVRVARAYQEEQPPEPPRHPCHWPGLLMPSLAPVKRVIKPAILSLAALTVLLMAGACWWWWTRPKKFILLHSYPFLIYAIIDTQYCKDGVLIERILQGSSDFFRSSAPHAYTLLGWDGKPRWQVFSSAFADKAKVCANSTAQLNLIIYHYSTLKSLSPDCRVLAEAQLSPQSFVIRRWRDGLADGKVQFPNTVTPINGWLPAPKIQVTDSGRIWLYEETEPDCQLWCIDGETVAYGTHWNPCRGWPHCTLSPDSQMLICDNGSNRKAEYNTVQVVGHRIVVTPIARQQQARQPIPIPVHDMHVEHATVKPGEFRLASTPDGQYVLNFTPDLGATAGILADKLGLRNKLERKSFSLYDRSGRLCATMSLHLHDSWLSEQFSPRSFVITEHGAEYQILSWALSPDGRRLALTVSSTCDYKQSLFLYKW